jgi:hypothetical protein
MVTRALPSSVRAAPDRAVMVGDRLDTDVAAARAAGVVAMLVLSGVHGPADLLAAPGLSRPHLLGHDLRDLARDHPDVVVTAPGTARCRGTLVQVTGADGGEAAVSLDRAPGGCLLDVVRAVCSATWSVADGLPPMDRQALIAAVVADGVLPPAEDIAADGCGQGAAALPVGSRGG